MKKVAFIISLIIYSFLFSSCYIYFNNDDDYVEVDNCKYYKNYEDMRKRTIAEINEAFSDFHWNEEKFDKKYNEYECIAYQEDLDVLLLLPDYKYCVRTGSSWSLIKDLKYTNGKAVSGSGKYFLITQNDDEQKSAVFFK